MKVVGYVRVSTNEQDAESQRESLRAFAKERKLKVTQWVEETVSSRKRKEDREVSRMVAGLKKGDMVLVTELSRLGRSSMSEVLALVEAIRDRGAGLVVRNPLIEVLPGERPSVFSEAMLSSLSMAARLERDMITERTKAGLKAAQAKGKKLGRPVGSSKVRDMLREKDAEIQRLLDGGVSKAAIGRLLGVSRVTVHKYLKGKRLKGKAA